MFQKIDVNEGPERIAEYVDRVADHGERFIIMMGGNPVAELVPLNFKSTQFYPSPEDKVERNPRDD